MKITDVRERAKEIGLRPGKMKKDELVREIQKAEGNFACFQTGILEGCQQFDCCWREDCY